MTQTVFEGDYDDETLIDLQEDINDTLDSLLNTKYLEKDENGFIIGEFRVVITHNITNTLKDGDDN